MKLQMMLVALFGCVALAGCTPGAPEPKDTQSTPQESCKLRFSTDEQRNFCEHGKDAARHCAAAVLNTALGQNINASAKIQFDIAALLAASAIDGEVGAKGEIDTGLRELLDKHGNAAEGFVKGYRPCLFNYIEQALKVSQSTAQTITCPTGYRKSPQGSKCVVSNDGVAKLNYDVLNSGYLALCKSLGEKNC